MHTELKYDQATGSMYLRALTMVNEETGAMTAETIFLGSGYSGRKGKWRNCADWEQEAQHGPIPKGLYTLGRARNSTKTGPVAIDLTPFRHEAHGRSAFQIHGDNKAGDASSGCIVLPRGVRERIDKIRKEEGPDLLLEVY